MVDNDSVVQDSNTIDEPNNAWVVKANEEVVVNEFSISLRYSPAILEGISEGDVFLIIGEDVIEEGDVLFQIAQIFRKRSTIAETTFYFDRILPIDPSISVDKLNIVIDKETIKRIRWNLFEEVLSKTAGIDYSSLPIVNGKTKKQRAYIRELLQNAVKDDLLGPANGPEEEIIDMSVRDRYLVGKLAPQNTIFEEEDNLAGSSGYIDPDENEGEEVDTSTNQSLVPSSMGLTFCVGSSAENIEIIVNWGCYEPEKSDRINEKTGRPFKAWRRIPCGGTAIISLEEGLIEPISVDKNRPEIIIQGSISGKLENGDRLVTLFLVNTQNRPEQNQDQAWIFQPEIIIHDTEKSPIFRRRPFMNENGSDMEIESLEMIYRKEVEFAVGHGVSVHAIPDNSNPSYAYKIKTSVMPEYEVPVTETPGFNEKDRPAMRNMINAGYLDMVRLSELDKEKLIEVLKLLTNDYSAWISEQKDRIGIEVNGFDSAADKALSHCEDVRDRLEEGIKTLDRNTDALEAFRFANKAMASQRIHSIYALHKRRGEETDISEIDIPKNRTWRPFQLAFILLSIPAMADPTHHDRTGLESIADLLWFPTGGGKTEAYLGVAAFTMAIRRIQGDIGGLDSSRGLAVIMRYTLRLLTLQQFQRATTLICAMEDLRHQDPQKWGYEPFTIGLWVGIKSTPNKTSGSHESIERERDGRHSHESSPAQLTSCPWCGSEIVPGRDIIVNKDFGKTILYCGDKLGNCKFSKKKSKGYGLPVLVVDEEIYHRPPTMLIATVDKFARMAWEDKSRTLFGKASRECERHGLLWPDSPCSGNHNKKGNLPRTQVKQVKAIRPPDLIIQDELHLISGPLGTMVGLYETAVDELSSWTVGDSKIKPKILASTATVRRADEQVNNVFLRKVSVFPPHGLDVEDNFFSVQRPIEEIPGRRYLGICSPGSSRPAVLIRVYVALLTAAQSLFNRFGQVADPYMTLVGYFNSKRELGGMRRLAEDDVQTRSYRVEMSEITRPGLSQRAVRIINELTSRVSSSDIPKILDQLEVKHKESWVEGETRALDIILATNMISVGVDVNRLGLMVVNGQPKSTAEYIQATSRVGRSFPGLVCTVLTWARPRDLSHYETFEHYHATFYKHVEAQSVTPFAPRALDRGLTGILVSLLRHKEVLFNPNLGAQNMNDTSAPIIDMLKKIVTDRAWKIKGRSAKKRVDDMIAHRFDQWVREANRSGRKLGYESKSRQGDIAPLLKKPGRMQWDEFTVPNSMREVEPGVRLIIDVSKLGEGPEWQLRDNEEGDS